MISFDQILEKRIGTGFYQWKTLSIIGLVELCDGIKYTFMSIVIAILKKEWNLTSQQIASLGSVFLFGILLGNFLCAFLTDRIGRKTTFILSTGFAVVLLYYISYCQNFKEMIILRLLFGLVYGITYPLGFIFISEISVANYRGRFSLGLSLIYIFGKIYFILLCFVYLEDYTSGNWRGLIRFNGIPITVAFILSFLFLHETIRYLLNKGQFQQAFEEIEFALQQNNQLEVQLQEEEKQGLQNWSNQQQIEHQAQELNKFGILSKEYRKVTIILWCLYIMTNLQNMSIYFLMPFLFAQNNSGFLLMLNISILEFIFALIIYRFIDEPNHGGRIRIIAYSAIALIIANGLLFSFKQKFLYFGMSIIKVAIRGLLSTIGLVSCECYPLLIRSQGCGVAQAIGKIAAIPSPYLLFPLFLIEPYLPFALMFILSIVILILAFAIKEDKTQKHLETLKTE